MSRPANATQRLQILRLVCGLEAALTALLSAPSAAEVLIFTDSRHPVKGASDARTIELDAAQRIKDGLAEGLPDNPSRAAILVQQRLHAGGDALQHRTEIACQGVIDAWSLGVAKLPAVVVDRRFVVYGDTDVVHALARIDAVRGGRP